MTSSHYNDIFITAVKAAGNKLKRKPGTKGNTKHLPKAGFDQMANLLGAM